MNKLLPCPFCGSPAELERGHFGEIFPVCTNNNCGARFGCGIWFTKEQQAIDTWNSRVNQPSSTMRIECSGNVGIGT